MNRNKKPKQIKMPLKYADMSPLEMEYDGANDKSENITWGIIHFLAADASLISICFILPIGCKSLGGNLLAKSACLIFCSSLPGFLAAAEGNKAFCYFFDTDNAFNKWYTDRLNRLLP